MDGGCRKLAIRKVPRAASVLATDSCRKPPPGQASISVSKDQKESSQGGAREVAGGKQGTSESEECAREGGRMFNMDDHSPQ